MVQGGREGERALHVDVKEHFVLHTGPIAAVGQDSGI